MNLAVATHIRRAPRPDSEAVGDETTAYIEKLTHDLDVTKQSRKYWMRLCGDRDSLVAALQAEVEVLRIDLGNLHGTRHTTPDGLWASDEGAVPPKEASCSEVSAPPSTSPTTGLLGLPPPLTQPTPSTTPTAPEDVETGLGHEAAGLLLRLTPAVTAGVAVAAVGIILTC